MGSLLDKLLANAEKAKKENDFLEDCLLDLEKIKSDTQQKLDELNKEKKGE